MSFSVCPCDGAQVPAPANPPGQTHIAYRAGDFLSFREAVLTPAASPPEQTLSFGGSRVWRADGPGDLAVMIAEWFAYIADVICFYNERIANEDYLRTAARPSSVADLIGLLGYRPRPAIGAWGRVAALVSPTPTFGGAPITLPKGLQFQSKPTPGLPPQTFELDAETQISAPDSYPVAPEPQLIGDLTSSLWNWLSGVALFEKVGPASYAVLNVAKTMKAAERAIAEISAPTLTQVQPAAREAIVAALSDSPAFVPIVFPTTSSTLLLQGAPKGVGAGSLLRLRRLDSSAGPWLATVQSTRVAPAPAGGGQQTTLTVSFDATPDSDLTAAAAILESAGQKAGLWTFFPVSVSGGAIHLASLQRQIQPGDWVLFTAQGGNAPAPALAEVATVQDAIWDANASALTPASTTPPFASTTVYRPTPSGSTTETTNPLPTPHTVLTLTTATALPDAWNNATGVSVGFGWTSVGTLLDQPYAPWSGAPLTLANLGATPIPGWSQQPIQLQDSTGLGVDALASQAQSGAGVGLATFASPPPPLQPPFLALPNLLKVSCGKTVTNEVLGSGDATQAGQDFKLSQSPVTYLQNGAGYASTIALTVNGLPWKEVASFYGQGPDANVFVTREDAAGKTHAMFGDGVDGARLPSGANNVVATYRVGAGKASPPAGQLTVIAKPWPGLRAILNPVAVGGGADAQPADLTRHFAPQSVLTFGRAVSVFDYQAIAAEAPGVARAGAVWSWDDARQRALVQVFVGDDDGAVAAATAALSVAGDPNRPVSVTRARAVPVALTISLVFTPGMDPDAIAANIATALTDEETGLFGSWRLGVGQRLFASQIEAAALGVAGAVAILSLIVRTASATLPGPIFDPGAGAYFTLDPADIDWTTEADPHG